MKLHELSPAPGAVSDAKRKGRGLGSGNGKTAGKGHKGQNARSGGGTRPGFEGGQMPYQRRVPKRGFKNIFALSYTTVNVERLNGFRAGSTVDAAALLKAGVISREQDGVKILGRGELTKKLTVRATSFTEGAKAKIEAAGGKAEVV